MKLALVRQTYTHFGGAERFLDRAMGELRASGADVAVIARAWPGHQPGSDFVRCDPFFIGRTWRDAGFARGVQGIIAGGAFDLVQSHERIPGCQIYRAGDGVHATWLALRDRVRSPLARHATRLQPWHRYTLGAEAAMYRDKRLRAVICNSNMVRNDIAARFGLGLEKLHLIRNGVDLDHFDPALCRAQRQRMRSDLGIPARAPVALFVGSGFERKGLPQLLAAFAALPKVDAHLIVAGRDRKSGAMQRLAHTLGCAARVHFVGAQQDVRPCYGAADAFVLPTLYDPFPNAALEAMACGLPVLTSSTSGIAELVRPGENGYVVDAHDVNLLGAQLERTLEGSAAMGEAARATAEGLPLAATARQLLALYRELMDGRD